MGDGRASEMVMAGETGRSRRAPGGDGDRQAAMGAMGEVMVR